MADPIIVECPEDAWTKVATNVLSGTIKIVKTDPDAYYETYRMTGNPAPTTLVDGFPFKEMLDISDGLGIDVYVWPKGAAGRVRVDL